MVFFMNVMIENTVVKILKFTWNKSEKKWSLRQRGFAIGRMYFASPAAGERFYLRTLLTVVKGPTSFEDVRTVNGQVRATFKAACFAYGLLEDDSEWMQCLQEASEMQVVLNFALCLLL